MATPKFSTHVADFETPSGVLGLSLSFSDDFTGRVDGKAVDGSVIEGMEWDASGRELGTVKVVRTTGTVWAAFVTN